MEMTKSVVNMVLYAIIIVLILLLGLSVMKSKSKLNDSADKIDSAAKTAAENKDALDKLQTLVDSKIALAAKSLENQINVLRSVDTRLQTQMTDMQKKPEDDGSAKGGALQWKLNPLTGHRYSVMPYPLPWHWAKKYAEDNGGHLVIVNDENENNWLVTAFGSDTEYWIGATDEAQEKEWLWVDGTKCTYFNWAPPEPDNYRLNQHYAIINSKAPHLKQTDAGRWNDVECNGVRLGIIEQDSVPKPLAPRPRILP
jgi:hypothetical protein